MSAAIKEPSFKVLKGDKEVYTSLSHVELIECLKLALRSSLGSSLSFQI